jgi:CubicO group peptidase (beta-lactamase class C family)
MALIAALPLAPASAQSSITSMPLERALDSVASRIFRRGAAPGVSVVVVRDTEIVYLKGFGFADLERKRPVTPETEFYIASATKSFTALAVALLDARGVIRLDSAIDRYLPGLPLRDPLVASAITVRELLTHTHGIDEGPVTERLSHTGRYRDNAELIRLLARHDPNARGRAFRYGNIGYNIVSFAMDTVMRESWKVTLRRLVLEPLGMHRTSAYVTGRSRGDAAQPYVRTAGGFVRATERKTDATLHAAGGMMTTARDMAAWLEVQMSGGSLDGRQLFPRAVVAETHRPMVRLTGSVRGVRNVGYGLGWQIGLLGADTIVWHGGAFTGFATHMSFMPQQRLGIVVMANEGTAGRDLTDAMAYAIYDTLRPRFRR